MQYLGFSTFPSVVKVLLMFCAGIITANNAVASQLTFAWDANSEPHLAGYKLHYGQASRNYTSTVNVGNTTSYIVSGLQDGKTYYFAVTAYETMGTIESGYSNEVSRTVGNSGAVAGLVAAYGFDEASGSLVGDASGNGNDGMMEGATRVTQGRFGKALSFNGNAWVTVNDSASLDLTSGMTLQAWVYPTVPLSGWRSVIMKESDGDAVYYLEANSDKNKPVMAVKNDAMRLYGRTQLPANTWTHLAATYDGTRQRLYVNGVEVASRKQRGPITQSDGALRIGGNSLWGEFFTGLIDEVRIYNWALTVSEIERDMSTAVTP